FGDAADATSANPQHIYTMPGRYEAVLTVTDGHGGLARDTVVVLATSGTGFPGTPVLDDFERPDGPIGRPWVGSISGLAIRSGALIQTGTRSYAVWDSLVMGPDQEVHATFEATTDSAEHTLMLKVQGRSWQDGHVQVNYDSRQGVTILTYDRTAGWRR